MAKEFLFLSNTLFLIHYFYCTIVLPVETLPRENYKLTYEINSTKDIMDQENRNSFFTIFEMGAPVQKVPLIIKPKTNFYTITSVNIVPNTTMPEITKFNLSENFFKTYDFYDEKKSNSHTLNWCRESEFYFAEECCSVNDTILFYHNVNMKNKTETNIYFELMRNVQDNITGEIGLNLYDAHRRIYNTFLGIMKTNNLISNYYWYFDFDSWNDTKGKIVIGSLPHEDYPYLYSEKNLFFTNSNPSTRLTYMEMKFDKIYIINNDTKIYFCNEAEFRYDSKIIIGDHEYEKYLLKQIDNLIKEKKCFNDTIRDFDYFGIMNFYYCKNDKEIKKKLEKIISPIYFFSNDFNYTFEINKDEILREKDEYIYIQMLFNDITRKWSLGTVFSLKYKFVFNQDLGQIGFYKIKEGKNSNKNLIVLLKAGVIILLCAFLIFLGIQIGKILKKTRKKRANELTDEYDYYSESKKEYKSDINNDLIGNNNYIN